MVRPTVAFLAACCLLAWPASPALADGRPATGSWVEVHRQTGLWSWSDDRAQLFRVVQPGARFQIALPQRGPRLYVWDPSTRNYAFVDAVDVGPVGGPPNSPPASAGATDHVLVDRVVWSGTARVTMYTCVELGGCNRTASGVWPYEGVVAVDPALIPLGSMVWIDGLGIFLAADTGSAVHGSRIDVCVDDYSRARIWGVQFCTVSAYIPGR